MRPVGRFSFYAAALTRAHLARWAAAIFLRAAADIVRLGFGLAVVSLEARLAHRAFCARLIFLRAAAERVRFGPG